MIHPPAKRGFAASNAAMFRKEPVDLTDQRLCPCGMKVPWNESCFGCGRPVPKSARRRE